MADDLTLTVAGRTVSGWMDVRVTRGIERCPSDFDISLTERFPGEAAEVVVQGGDECVVKIDGVPVVTGFVDTFHPSIAGSSHTIRIAGRGKCQDLVDCAAEWPGGQISGSSALEIASKIASVYEGLEVWSLGVDVGAPIPQINLILGETGWEIIERVCRFRGLLAYETADGNLFLSQAGTVKAASGFTEGVNVQAASIEYSVAQRFQEYVALLQSMDRLGDVGEGGNLLGITTDANVKRHRRMVIIAEYGDSGGDVCKERAQWEAARRTGRSSCLHLTTDSWRDSAGVLWEPNTLVQLVLPSLKLADATWLISEVTYKRDESGTTADLVIMPRTAFLPQPILLNPTFQDVPSFSANPAP